MNNEFLLKVVNYVADHFGNLPDNSKPGFENFTNDEFDTAVKYLAEIGVLKLNQSKENRWDIKFYMSPVFELQWRMWNDV